MMICVCRCLWNPIGAENNFIEIAKLILIEAYSKIILPKFEIHQSTLREITLHSYAINR